MNEGGWVVLGAAIGTLGSVSTTWLAAHLARQSPYPKYDKAIKQLLRDLLEKGPQWRKIQTLSAVTGLPEKEAKEYLILIGARGSETNKDLWGLIPRNPLSEVEASPQP